MRGSSHDREVIRYVEWAPERSGLMCLVEAEGLVFVVLGGHVAVELSCGG